MGYHLSARTKDDARQWVMIENEVVDGMPYLFRRHPYVEDSEVLFLLQYWVRGISAREQEEYLRENMRYRSYSLCVEPAKGWPRWEWRSAFSWITKIFVRKEVNGLKGTPRGTRGGITTESFFGITIWWFNQCRQVRSRNSRTRGTSSRVVWDLISFCWVAKSMPLKQF